MDVWHGKQTNCTWTLRILVATKVHVPVGNFTRSLMPVSYPSTCPMVPFGISASALFHMTLSLTTNCRTCSARSCKWWHITYYIWNLQGWCECKKRMHGFTALKKNNMASLYIGGLWVGGFKMARGCLVRWYIAICITCVIFCGRGSILSYLFHLLPPLLCALLARGFRQRRRLQSSGWHHGRIRRSRIGYLLDAYIKR